MGKTHEKALLLFQSVHEVLAAERHLKEVIPEIDVVPVPKELSSNCGVALEVVPERLKATIELLKRDGLKPQAVFAKLGEEYFVREDN
ncbi:MAG: DUF3343 domain-containing protein [Candidatus Zixiibacteriota bacterium]